MAKVYDSVLIKKTTYLKQEQRQRCKIRPTVEFKKEIKL